MKIDRREFLGALGAGMTGMALTRPGMATGCASAPKNVLFIAVDDLRPELAAYGQTQVITPNIDALAQRGTLFERCYCQVPICGASRASLLSGARADTTQIYELLPPLDDAMPGVLTLPDHFRANGYQTVSVGKVYHRANDDADGWTKAPWRPDASSKYVTAESQAIIDTYGQEPATEAGNVADNAYGDGQIADRAITELQALQAQPFFLAVGFMKPHLPFCAPQTYWDLYDPNDIDLADNPLAPAGAPTEFLTNWQELRQYYGMPTTGPLTDAQARHLIHGYYACASFIDAQIGRVVAELDGLGLGDDTVIVLWSDHGWNLGEHGQWAKHANFEPALQAPLIVCAPAVAGGARTAALVELVDIYPSLCDLCNLVKPTHLEGSSFAPLLEDPDQPWKAAVFSQYSTGYSVKTDRYRYTRWFNDVGQQGPTETDMLYDHLVDPAENTNIADLPENAALVASLRTLLADGWQSVAPPAIVTSVTSYVDPTATSGNGDGTSWEHAWLDLADALCAATPGTSVLVAEGAYIGSFTIPSGVAMYGGYPAGGGARDVNGHPTIIDANGLGRGVTIQAGAVLSGATVTGGNATGSGSAGDGGGVYLGNGGRITQCVVSGNSAVNNGGGIYASGSPVTIDRCAIIGNATDLDTGAGGGLYFFATTTATLENCLVVGNASGNGRALFLKTATATMRNCTVDGNSTGQRSVIRAMTGSALTMLNTIVSNNSGGGHVVHHGGSSVDMSHCMFFNNPTQGNKTQYGGPGSHTVVNEIPGNPLYVDRANGNFMYLDGSAAISAGSAPDAPPVDFNGVARPLDDGYGATLVELGAFEYIASGADTDADGMTDAWEAEHGLDPTDAATTNGANADIDGDGADNLHEFTADTDPFDASSRLAIDRVSIEGGDVRVDWRGGVQAKQVLECRSDLPTAGESWLPLITNQPPTTPTASFIHQDAQSLNRMFYRIRAER